MVNPPTQPINKPITIANSAAPAPGIGLKDPPPLSSPSALLSSDEFQRAIRDITKTQNETLVQCKSLRVFFNSKFDELKASVNTITSQLGELRSENATLRVDLTSLERRVTTMESNPINVIPSDNVNHVPNLLQELSDREKCLSNIVVHGLPEFIQLLPAAKISDDIKCINKFILPFSLSLPANPKLFRLRRVNADSYKPQPLKVVFPTKEQALQFISDFNTSKCTTESGNNLNTIQISRSTILERQELRRVYVELDKHKKSGELNISIRYKNRTLRIVQNSQGINQPNHRNSSSQSKN